MGELFFKQIEEAKNAISHSGIVCFPTETVMGLGIAFNDYQAYTKLNQVKNRPEDKPYTMMVKSIDDIAKYAFVNENISRVIKTFMPGSITLLLKAKDCVPDYVTHNTGIIGIRIPTNEEAIRLLEAVDIPLLVPSANKSGEKPALNSDEAKEIFKDEIDAYIDGICIGGEPSTIVDLSGYKPILIRKGPISFEAIECVYGGHKFEETVICYLFKNDSVLMMLRDKKDVDINKGKWIGVGGHIEKGETPAISIAREIKEETSLTLKKFKKVAKIYFFFKNDLEIMHVYASESFTGEVDYSCNEGTLKWIPLGEVFNLPLWEGDKLFLKPIFNKEPYFEMNMKYDGDTLTEYERR